MTELRNDRMTEGQTGQIQYSPHFSKRGYNYWFLVILTLNSKVFDYFVFTSSLNFMFSRDEHEKKFYNLEA